MAKKPDEEDLMSVLMDNIKDNIYFMDRDGRIVMINNEGARWLGFDTPDDAIGKTDLDIFSDEHGRNAYEDEQRIIQTGIPILGKEEKETWEDGRETWVSTTKLPLCKKNGEIVGTFGISRDITDRKKAELLAAHYADQNRRFRDAMESDLRMAAELQKTFLPSAYPAFPNDAEPRDSAVRFYHHYHSADVIGGDFCSIRQLSDTEAGILLFSVQGHGVRAALVSALVRASVEEISAREKDPGRFLEHMNKVLEPIIHPDDTYLFSTACYMILDCTTGKIRWASAGHPTPMLLNAAKNKAEWLIENSSVSAPALAMNTATKYMTFERVIQPGDAIIMFTDGLCTVSNAENVEFGTHRLLELAHKHRNTLLTDMFPILLEEIRSFADSGKFEDDICLVGFRFAHPMKI